jgi:hypothetical protein
MTTTLDFAAPLFRSLGLAPGAFRQVAGDQRSYEESKERHPILRVGNRKGSDWRQKEKVEGGSGSNGHNYRIAQAPIRRGQKHRDQKHERDGGVIDVQLEIDRRDYADGGDDQEIAKRLRAHPKFHTRIVRWT